ncbi:MAG: hypothetical protein LBJ10_02220, partial [Clostridiales bacterium]|nr:hypothetical protein [Clostridiales bacterium]
MGKKAITIESLAELRYMSGSAISPDGAYTAYVASGQDAERNEYESFIWLMDNRTREARQLTHAGKEGEFVWDGARSLLFPAARSESDKAKDFGEKT